jgi:hypothetical protein
MSERQEDQNGNPISAEIPDWSREKSLQFWDPGRKLLLSVRGGINIGAVSVASSHHAFASGSSCAIASGPSSAA